MSVAEFIYEAAPVRVIFGAGSLSALSSELERLKCGRPLVVATPSQAARASQIVESLKPRKAAHFAEATIHTPVEVTERALGAAEAVRADCVIAIGGGSATGLSKAIAVQTDLPQIVLPTTYAGSEMTSLLGETRAGVKQTRKDPKILPAVVIYDVELTMSLPPRISVASGLNGIAHAVESLYSRERNPIASLMAEEGVKLLVGSLPRISQNPLSLEVRSDALQGAWLCGACLGLAGMALHHKLCHVLGGLFNLPHSEMHAIILPHVLAYNEPAIPETMRRLRRAMETESPIAALSEMKDMAGLPRSLAEIGMPAEGIERAVDVTFEQPCWNPRELDRSSIHCLINDAYFGKRAR